MTRPRIINHLVKYIKPKSMSDEPNTVIYQWPRFQNISLIKDMEEGLDKVDIIMVLRIQKERMKGSVVPSTREFFNFWGLDRKKLNRAKKDALVMHPGPINRGVEIDSDVADDISRSLILEQVELGVAVRMAIIKDLLLET